MSNITLAPNASGTATFTVASPATNTNQVLTLPDATTTLVGTDATQTLTNKTVQGGTITRGSVQTPSSPATAVDFLSVIPSWAKRVTVMVNGLTSTVAGQPIIRIGSGGSIASTGYASTIGVVGTGTGAGSDTNGFLQVHSALTSMSFVSTIVNVSGNLWIASGNITYGGNTTGMTFGSVTLGGVLDSLRVTTLTGVTLTGGTVNIMWEG